MSWNCKKKKVFHHNAPVHSSRIAQQKLTKICLELLPHPAYSPDLAPLNFHLLPKLSSVQVVDYFEDFEENHIKENGELEETLAQMRWISSNRMVLCNLTCITYTKQKTIRKKFELYFKKMTVPHLLCPHLNFILK